LTVHAGKNLAFKDIGGSSDPYVVVTFPYDTLKYKSHVINKNLNPTWNYIATGAFGVTKEHLISTKDPVRILIWDKDKIGSDDYMGEVEIPAKDVLEPEYKQRWLTVQSRGKDKVSGEIQISLTYTDYNMPEDVKNDFLKITKLQGEEINKIHVEWKKENKTHITSKAELVALLKKLHLMESISETWDPKKNKAISDPKIQQAIMEDATIIDLIGDTLFRSMDANNDGSISLEELIVGFSLLSRGTKEERAKLTFKVRDRDSNGSLSRDEVAQLNAMTVAAFRAGFAIGIKMQASELRRIGMKEHDFDGLLGAITKCLGGPAVTKATTDLVFKYCDKNDDGMISEAEFISWSISDEEQQKYHEELNKVMQPFIEQMQIDIQAELRKIIARLSA